MTHDQSMDRLPDGPALAIEPVLAGTVVAHGLFRLNPCDMKAMRRRPGPIPERWERVPPTLLRYSDEQTVAGVAAVFTAIDEAGLEPERVCGLGSRCRVAVPRAGEPRPGPAQLRGGGRVGHFAAPDPPFCPPFPVGFDQPGAGAARAEPGGRRRASCHGGRFPHGPDLAGGRGRARASGWSSPAGAGARSRGAE